MKVSNEPQLSPCSIICKKTLPCTEIAYWETPGEIVSISHLCYPQQRIQEYFHDATSQSGRSLLP